MRNKNRDVKSEEALALYLREIDRGPLLSREQEQELVKSVEQIQNKVIEACLSNPYAKYELKRYLESLDPSEDKIVDISRRLEEESPKAEIEAMRIKFNQLIREFDKPNLTLLTVLLDEIRLSGTIVHGVIQEIKSKFNLVSEVEQRLKMYGKLFEIYTIDEIQEHISKLRNDDMFRKQRCSDYRITELRMMNKCREFDEIKAMFTQIQSQLPKNVEFVDVKSIYKTINTYEFQMKQSRDELIEKNLRLVVSRAKYQLNKGLEFEDLIQEGNIGLMKAIDKFDSSRNTKIGTYATWWIDQTIKRAISNKGKTVRIPTHIEWMQTKLSQAHHELSGKLKREPTIEELSKATGYTVQQINDMKVTAQHEMSIDDVTPSGIAIKDIVPSSMPGPDAVVDAEMRRVAVRNALSQLSPRSEMIIRLRYGIGELPDEEGVTLQEIAGHVDLTKQGVRLNECKALAHLKKHLKGFKHDIK